jgi:serine/threonine-protein kinase
VALVIAVVLSIVAVVLMRRSLRRGSSDRRGAVRVAVAFGLCLFLAWLVSAHHVIGGDDEARMLTAAVGEALLLAMFIYVFYIALEPGVRRNWPRSLIGWTRMLAGRFRDPMIGREILAGIAAGIVAQQGYWISSLIRAPFFVHESAVQPPSIFAGDRLIGLTVAVMLAIGTMFLLLLFRNLLGRTGGVALFAVLALAVAVTDPLTTVFQLVLLVTLLRFGLLAGAAMGWTVSLLSNTPMTPDVEAWYWPRALLVIVIVAGGAAWAAWTAANPRPASR